MRGLPFLLLVLAFVLPAKASAVSPVDPPVTYRLTVYGRDQIRLTYDGSVVQAARRLTPAYPREFPTRYVTCASAVVKGGVAELRVEITPECPAGSVISFLLIPAEPGGPITATAVPEIQWRVAYSEATSVVDAVVRPVPPRT